MTLEEIRNSIIEMQRLLDIVNEDGDPFNCEAYAQAEPLWKELVNWAKSNET